MLKTELSKLLGPIYSDDGNFAIYYVDEDDVMGSDLNLSTAIRVGEVLELAYQKLLEKFPKGPRKTPNPPGKALIVVNLEHGGGSTLLNEPISLNVGAMADSEMPYHEVTPIHELMHRFIYNYGGDYLTDMLKGSEQGQQIEWMIEGIASWAPIWVNNLSPSPQKIDDAFDCLKKSIFMRIKADGTVFPNNMYGAPFWIFLQGMMHVKPSDEDDPIKDYFLILDSKLKSVAHRNPSKNAVREAVRQAVEKLCQLYLDDKNLLITRIYNEYVLACTGPFWRMKGTGFERDRYGDYQTIRTATGKKIKEYHLVNYNYVKDLEDIQQSPTTIYISMQPGDNALLLKLTNKKKEKKQLHVWINDVSKDDSRFIMSAAQMNFEADGTVNDRRSRTPAKFFHSQCDYYTEFTDDFNTSVIVITRFDIWPYRNPKTQMEREFAIQINKVISDV